MEAPIKNNEENENLFIELYQSTKQSQHNNDETTPKMELEKINDGCNEDSISEKLLANTTSEQSAHIQTIDECKIVKEEDNKENNRTDLLQSYLQDVKIKDEKIVDDHKHVKKIEQSTKSNDEDKNKVTTNNIDNIEQKIVKPPPEKLIKKQVKFKTLANGTIPKSGKPMMMSLNKKANKPRGRPKRKVLPIYQSQISDNKFGIKLCIKKSPLEHTKQQPKATKINRKRTRKPKQRICTDSEDSEYEKRRRRSNNNTNKQKKDMGEIYEEPEEQSVWAQMPQHVLQKIFQNVVADEGSLPTIVRLGKVCSLWYQTSLSPLLWQNIDLTTWIKEPHRNELQLKWIIENRLSNCKDINLGNWKIKNIQCVLQCLLESCPNLVGISLTGWKGFTSEHLMFIVENFAHLSRLDLSSVNVDLSSSKSAVALGSLLNAIQTMNTRLTNLYLAHNRLAGIPQFITTLATHCPNLLVLDLSNVSTIATSHGILHIEKLQVGCPKLKVLLITNSHITLSSASLQEQMDSPGFPELEELSVASLADESRLINDEYLQRILKTSTKLKLLDVRGCARLTHDSLIRLPTWDIKHLFLSGCSVTRDLGSGLELIASKWAHSLTELDLAWANVQGPLDNALKALAEKGSESPLSHLNLCGSSVSVEAVKEILKNCKMLNSINLSSCRGLPRGVKRFIQGNLGITVLRENLGVLPKIKPTEKNDNNSDNKSAT